MKDTSLEVLLELGLSSLRSSSFAAGEHVFIQPREPDLPSIGNISHCSRRGDANKSSQSIIGSTVSKFKYTLHDCSLPDRIIRWAPQCSNSFQNQRLRVKKIHALSVFEQFLAWLCRDYLPMLLYLLVPSVWQISVVSESFRRLKNEELLRRNLLHKLVTL